MLDRDLQLEEPRELASSLRPLNPSNLITYARGRGRREEVEPPLPMDQVTIYTRTSNDMT